MKRTSLLITLAVLMLSMCVVSCRDQYVETTGVVNGQKGVVSVITRSTVEMDYPVTLYAFYSNTGKLAQSVVAEDEGDDLSMELAVGDYHLVAMAGTDGLTDVESPAGNKGIGFPESGLISSPVLMGSADISVVEQDQEARIEMTIQVASVDISLQDMPSDIVAVSVTLSTLYTDLTFYGEPSGASAVRMTLNKDAEDGNWKASAYTLPGSSTKLTLSICMTDESGMSTTYGYTHETNLCAATPYRLVGSFKEGFSLSGVVTAAGWNDPVDIAFTFGQGAGNNPNNGEGGGGTVPGGNGDGNYSVTEIPEAKSIWEGHFVAAVENKENNTAELLLLSLDEWTTEYSEIASVISQATSNYSENGLADWQVPTVAELSGIIPSLSMSGQIDRTNKTLTDNNGDRLCNGEKYLCDAGANFLKMGDDAAAKAVTSSGSYHLRLVKKVCVVKKS